MSALHPNEETRQLPLTREVGLTTLAIGIILGFPTAIAGASIYLFIQFWRVGETRRMIRIGIFGPLIAFLLYFFLQSEITDISIKSRFYDILNVVLLYGGGFLGLAFIHLTVKRYEAAPLGTPFQMRWPPFFATFILGIGLIVGMVYITDTLSHKMGVCRVSGIKNTLKTAIEFRGLKSALLQEKDLKDHCRWQGSYSSIDEKNEFEVRHYISSYLETVSHQIEKRSELIQSDAIRKYDDYEADFALSLPNVGNSTASGCNVLPVTADTFSTRCWVVVHYDFIVSNYHIQSFSTLPQEEIEQLMKTALRQTDPRIQKLDHP